MKRSAKHLPVEVYSARQVRDFDRIAIEQNGIAGYELMCRAGDAALECLRRHWPNARSVLIYCGAGNNAGDGYVIARLAAETGLSVLIRAATDPERLGGDAARAWQDCKAAGGSVDTRWASGSDEAIGADVVVDALLGTGLDRDLAGPYAAAVAEINAAQRPVLAIDVPSGLDADTGQPHGSAVRAAVTISFVGLKTGLFLGLAADFCGDIEFSDLGLEAGVFAAHTPVLKRVTERELRAALPQRRRTAHKGSHGRLLVMGGGPGMGGAIRLAAEAALRTGAGLVYVVTHPENVQTVMGGRPEIICRGLSAAQFDEFEQGVDAVVLGPGLGQSDWAARAWRHFAAMDAPMILDADGLNWLARRPIERNRWLLTPHPGEAARLLGSSTADVEADRRGAAEELAGRHRACVVLKGANSLVAIPGPQTETFVCTAGNPGMATAGMGDVLSGVLGGLLAQTSDIQLTAKAGVLLHARAGDAAAANGGERGLIASDLMPYLRAGANL